MNDFLILIEKPVALIASLLILIGQLTYLLDVWKKKIKPSILSWYGWALLMMTLLLAQLISIGWDWSLMSIITCTMGCIGIGTVALIKKNFSIYSNDWWFISLGIVCIILYLISNNPWLTTIYAALADLVIGLPTIIKAYKDPLNEKSNAWLISLFSWSLTLIISFNHEFIYAIFPIYVWLYCIIIFYLIYLRRTNYKYNH
ncbi:MAG: hypothetical protein CL846_02930 [Crocinitomicaceae bacterium]|nr:hypothetical protein [Crocinitomicaceae bacterium]